MFALSKTDFYQNEQEKYDQQQRLQRALKKAQEYKQLYEEAKQELVKERGKANQKAFQLEKVGIHNKDAQKLHETTQEL